MSPNDADRLIAAHLAQPGFADHDCEIEQVGERANNCIARCRSCQRLLAPKRVRRRAAR